MLATGLHGVLVRVVIATMTATMPSLAAAAYRACSIESSPSGRLASTDLGLQVMDLDAPHATAASWRRSLGNVVAAYVVLKQVVSTAALLNRLVKRG